MCTPQGHPFPQLYEYHALESQDTIRVLRLHPDKNTLGCYIQHVEISSGQYEALSYEWGNADETLHIQVYDGNDEPFGFVSVTANLHSALRDLRDSTEIDAEWLYIDQISIHQADPEEKAHQVGRMGDIYRSASRVITYLGPHSPDMDTETRALQLLDRLYTHFEPNYPYLSTIEGIEKARVDTSILPVPQPPPLDEEGADWRLLIHIVYGAWLRRLWMVQENVLCPSAVMLRGRRRIDWFTVAAIPLLVCEQLLPRNRLTLERASLGFTMSVERLMSSIAYYWVQRCDHAQQIKTLNSTLATNLHVYAGKGSFKCKDPRDGFYALLGMSSDQKALGIVPDYHQPVNELYTSVSARIFLVSQNLLLLNAVKGPLPDFPSWAYRGSPDPEWESDDFYLHSGWQTQIRFEGETMVVRGRIVDTLQHVTNSIRYMRSPRHPYEQSLYFIDMLKAVADLLSRAWDFTEALTPLVHASIAHPAFVLPPEFHDSALGLYCVARCWAMWLVGMTSGAPRHDVRFRRLIPELLQRLREHIRDRPTYLTDDPWSALHPEELRIGRDVSRNMVIQGHCLALSAAHRVCNTTRGAQPGDVMAVLTGSRLAYVLRPRGDRFQYVGPAYVRELVDDAGDHGPEPREDTEIRLV